MGQGSQSSILAVHWTGTSHFTHHHSQFAAATRHSQSTSTTHKMKYFRVVFLWKMKDVGFWFPSPYATVERTGKRRSFVFWFGTGQLYEKHILNPTVSQDRSRYLRIEKAHIRKDEKTEKRKNESCWLALLFFWYPICSGLGKKNYCPTIKNNFWADSNKQVISCHFHQEQYKCCLDEGKR